MKKLFILIVCVCSLAMVGNVYASSSSDSDSEANAGASIDSHDNITNKSYDRKFVNPGGIPIPMTNGFFTAPTPDSSFRSIIDIIKVFGDGFEVQFSKGALENL